MTTLADTLFDPPAPSSGRSAFAAGAKSRRSMQRNGLRYGPAENDIRATPSDLFRQLDREFGFTVDVCASIDNAKCPRFFSEADNGLVQAWAPERCWMNPPYSEIEPWTKKAVAESCAGAVVVGLLPVRTDLGWFHRDVLIGASEIRFLRGRMRFEQGNGTPMWATAPHPSMLVVWRQQANAPDGKSPTCARCGEPATKWSGAWVLETGWIGWCSNDCKNAWLDGDKSADSQETGSE